MRRPLRQSRSVEPYVLVVDDEEPIAQLLAVVLRDAGFTVRTALDPTEALALATGARPELVLLDVMMPGDDGFAVQRRLVEEGVDVPVIFLTAVDAVADKVRALTGGAYDYVTKPFDVDELVARVRAVLRRFAHDAGPAPTTLRYADLTLDEVSGAVTRAGRPVHLTPTEFKLLRYLMLNRERVLTKAQILDHVWNYDFGGDAHVLENYISYLRKRIDSGGPPLIRTVRGRGYSLHLDDGSDADGDAS